MYTEGCASWLEQRRYASRQDMLVSRLSWIADSMNVRSLGCVFVSLVTLSTALQSFYMENPNREYLTINKQPTV